MTGGKQARRAVWGVALAGWILSSGVGHGQEPIRRADRPAGIDSALSAGGPRSDAGGREGQPVRAARDTTPYRMPPFGKALFDHPHNKLIHFPIVLTLVATAFLLVARRKPELEPLAFWLVWAAALSTLAAFFSGQAQAEHFQQRPKKWLVEVHRKQGITIGVAQALWVLSLLREKTRRYAWLWGLVVSFLVLTAGFLGGLVAHGR